MVFGAVYACGGNHSAAAYADICMSSTITSISTDVLATSEALLEAHDALLRKLEANQQKYRLITQRFPSPPPGLGARLVVPARSPHESEGHIESSDSEPDVREVCKVYTTTGSCSTQLTCLANPAPAA